MKEDQRGPNNILLYYRQVLGDMIEVYQYTHALYSVNPDLKTLIKEVLFGELERGQGWLVRWLFGFYGISTFVGYLTPNKFLWKLFYFKQFCLA